jgi:hypothetical protein
VSAKRNLPWAPFSAKLKKSSVSPTSATPRPPDLVRSLSWMVNPASLRPATGGYGQAGGPISEEAKGEIFLARIQSPSSLGVQRRNFRQRSDPSAHPEIVSEDFRPIPVMSDLTGATIAVIHNPCRGK